MSTIAIPGTVQIKRSLLFALFAGVAVAAAAVTWVLSTYVFESGSSKAASASSAAPAVTDYMSYLGQRTAGTAVTGYMSYLGQGTTDPAITGYMSYLGQHD